MDLTDYGQVLGALMAIDDRTTAVDAVVHLGAIPAPGLAPNAVTFANNITSTYNVFEAARVAGIRRVVWASSETVLGLPFETPPPYVPVDEEYTPRPESSYSLAKTLEEEMARQFSRWDPTRTLIGLRFSNVMDAGRLPRVRVVRRRPGQARWNLWGYIDARDGAQAVRRALEVELTGVEVFIIANADTVMATPNAELLGGVPGRRGAPRGGEHETLLGIDKARRLLGFEPEHSWRDEGRRYLGVPSRPLPGMSTPFAFLVHPRVRIAEDLARVWRPLGRVPEERPRHRRPTPAAAAVRDVPGAPGRPAGRPRGARPVRGEAPAQRAARGPRARRSGRSTTPRASARASSGWGRSRRRSPPAARRCVGAPTSG